VLALTRVRHLLRKYPCCCMESAIKLVEHFIAGVPKPATGRIAVKGINHLGDEVIKVFPV